MSWTPLTAQSMPPDGELVLISNGKDIAIAEFVVDDKGRRFEFVILPADGEITHWQALPAPPA